MCSIVDHLRVACATWARPGSRRPERKWPAASQRGPLLPRGGGQGGGTASDVRGGPPPRPSRNGGRGKGWPQFAAERPSAHSDRSASSRTSDCSAGCQICDAVRQCWTAPCTSPRSSSTCAYSEWHSARRLPALGLDRIEIAERNERSASRCCPIFA